MSRSGPTALLLLLVVLPFEVQAKDDYESGVELLKGERPLAAIESFSRALEGEPKHWRALLLRAVAYEKIGQLENSESDFSAALVIKPGDARLLRLLGSVRIKLKKYAEAIGDLDKAIALEPLSGRAFFLRAQAHFGLRDRRAALEDASQAFGLGERVPKVLILRAECWLALGKSENAISDATVILREERSNLETLLLRARAFREDNKPYQSRCDQVSAVLLAKNKAQIIRRLSQGDSDQLLMRGVAKVASGDANAAVEDFSRALELDPRNAFAYRFRGEVRWKAGDPAGGLEDLGKAMDLRPWCADDAACLGRLRASQGGLGAGRAEFLRATELAPRDLRHLLWAVASGASANLLTQFRERTPDLSEWEGELLGLFVGKVSEERIAAAISSGRTAQERSGRALEVHCYLGLRAEKEGRPQIARKHYSIALETQFTGYWEQAWVKARLSLLGK